MTSHLTENKKNKNYKTNSTFPASGVRFVQCGTETVEWVDLMSVGQVRTPSRRRRFDTAPLIKPGSAAHLVTRARAQLSGPLGRLQMRHYSDWSVFTHCHVYRGHAFTYHAE